jgi:hypothetical protein
MLVGSASGTNAPAVFLYAYETTVGAKQSGGLAGARPKPVVWQTNGSCCLPEKTGPLTEWSMTSSDDAKCLPSEATSRLRPIARPVTSQSRLPSDCAWKLDVTSWPSEAIRTSAGLVLPADVDSHQHFAAADQRRARVGHCHKREPPWRPPVTWRRGRSGRRHEPKRDQQDRRQTPQEPVSHYA